MEAVDVIIEHLKRMSKQVTTPEEIAQVSRSPSCCLRRRLASGEGIVTLTVWFCVCLCVFVSALYHVTVVPSASNLNSVAQMSNVKCK